MSKIFISYAHDDYSIVQRLTAELQRRNHNVFMDQQSIRAGAHWQEEIKRHLQSADIFIALVTDHSDKSYYFNIEVTAAISYVKHSNVDKLILPVVLDQATLDDRNLGAFQALFGRSDHFEDLIHEIENAIVSFEGYRLAQEEIKSLRKKSLEENSADYVKETMDDLQTREKIGRQLAARWHLAGYGALVLSVITVFVLWWLAERSIGQSSPDSTRLIFDAVKGIAIVTLLIGLARYSFLLAKSHQAEALKNADRTHAIAFGKFYMRIFGSQVTATELKDVFQHWNTAGNNDLSHLDVDKIDSRVSDLLGKLTEKFDLKTKS